MSQAERNETPLASHPQEHDDTNKKETERSQIVLTCDIDTHLLSNAELAGVRTPRPTMRHRLSTSE